MKPILKTLEPNAHGPFGIEQVSLSSRVFHLAYQLQLRRVLLRAFPILDTSQRVTGSPVRFELIQRMKPTSGDELLSLAANVLATVYPERSDRAGQLLEPKPLIKQ